LTRLQSESGGRSLPFDQLIFWTFVVLLPVALGAAPKIFRDGDVSWHLAAGQWIIAHARIPQVDPFSFTMAGHAWVAFEWLAEVIYAGAFAIAGYPGMAMVVMAALAALHCAIFQFLVKRSGPVFLALAFVAMDLVLISFLLARPHVLVWPILATWTAVLLDCRDKGRKPPLRLAILMLIWANLHGSFLLGFAIAGAVALDALNARKWDRRLLLGWLGFGLLSLMLTLFNANGLTGFLQPFHIMGLENLAYIDEWQPSTLRSSPIFFTVLAGTVAAIAMRRPKFAAGELLLLLFLTVMAFLQVRHQSWLAIVAALILAPKFAGRRVDESSYGHWTWKAALAAPIFLVAGMVLPAQPGDDADSPRNLLAHVPPELRREPVFNGYGFGGPLILAGIRPYIDGRSEMYGDPFVADYFEMARGDAGRFEKAVHRYGIAWTILPPNTGLVAVLDASPDWTRFYADRSGVIHVRRAQIGKQPQ